MARRDAFSDRFIDDGILFKAGRKYGAQSKTGTKRTVISVSFTKLHLLFAKTVDDVVSSHSLSDLIVA